MKQQLKYNIGLDFGTYQSKICVLRISENPQKHEFVQFRDNNNKLSYFLPSQIEWLNNNKFRYGYKSNKATKAIYNYFKIASAEDKEFRIVSDLKNIIYQKESNFKPFTPEFLSVLYITNILFFIKDKYKNENKEKLKGGGILIKKYNLLPQSEDIELNFSIQLGIPTEYSYKVNIERRRKFETILLLADKLQKKLETIDNFLDKTSDKLIEIVKNLLEDIEDETKHTHFEELLKINNLSVFPETAAGLTFLVHKKKVPPGFYSVLDIGAGSSDLSFFIINEDYTISYLAAEAFMVAANNVSIEYLKLKENTIAPDNNEIKQIEEKIKSITEYDQDTTYSDSVKLVFSQLYRRIYYVFSERVFPWFENNSAYKEFKFQPCFVYGGGSKLPIQPYFSQILLSDQGHAETIDDSFLTYAIRKPISEYIPLENIIPQDETWRSDFELLVTAFGLSFEHKGENAEYFWNSSDYKENKTERKLVQHPINEGMFIYDVLERKFDGHLSYEVLPENDKIFIKSFSIKNFQGINNIDNIEISENAQWVFLTGENGFGKTSVLRALLIGLYGKRDGKIVLADDDIYVKVKGSGIDNIISPNKDEERFKQINQFAAYGTSRLNIDGDENKRLKAYSLFNTDGILLNIEDELIKWEKDKKQNKYYENVKQILLKLLAPYIIDIEIKREGIESKVLYTEKDSIDENDKNKVSFYELASGFRSVIAMAGDIILRLSEKQPDDIQSLKGIVIIDEFDLHLHPTWQKDMVKRFSETFPKVQFIVSTHSPIPLLGAPENSIFLKVDRDKEGITLKKLNINVSVLQPNSILTSPIFEFDDINSDEIDIDKIETSDRYSNIESEKRLKEKLQILKQNEEEFFNDLITRQNEKGKKE